MDIVFDFFIGIAKVLGAFALLALVVMFVIRFARNTFTLAGGAPYGAIPYISSKNTILVFNLSGPVLTDPTTVSPWARRFASFGEELKLALMAAANNDAIKGVVVRCSTPGGSPVGSQLIAEGIEACKEKKPVFVHVTDMCASGGVWALCGATRIFAARDAIVGSIGVRGASLVRYSGVTELGSGLLGGHIRAKSVTVETMHRGKGKIFGSPFEAEDPEVRKHYEHHLETMYGRFLERVASARRTSVEKLRSLGALMFEAPDAVHYGLIDAVGTYEEAKVALAKELGVPVQECFFLKTRKVGRFGPSLSPSALLSGGAGSHTAMHELRAALRQESVLTVAPMFLSE